jgi:uncharacterized protein (TIGR03083 family)
VRGILILLKERDDVRRRTMSAPEQHVSVLQAEMQRLEEFLGTLSHEDWQRSSRCDQWTVADVVAHLTAIAQYSAALIVGALHGDTSPPQEVPTLVGPAADIAHYAIAVRQRLSDDLLPTFIAAQRAFHETLATIGPADWDKPCYQPHRRVAIGWVVDGYIAERTLHGWDIQSVFDSHARLSPACLPLVIEWNAQRRRWRQAPSDAAPLSPSIRYRFDVTGVPHYRTDVILTDAHQYMEAVGKAPADVTVRCDGETFILLMYGRIRAQEAVSQGRITFEGDTELAAAFSQRFQGG